MNLLSSFSRISSWKVVFNGPMVFFIMTRGLHTISKARETLVTFNFDGDISLFVSL